MKTQTCSLLIPICAAVGSLLIIASPAQAVPYEVTLLQVGPDVVASGIGSIDLTGLANPFNASGKAAIIPSQAGLISGISPGNETFYNGPISGPSSFGSGLLTFANSGTGDRAGIASGPLSIIVPVGYVSDTALLSGATWNNATFASLGATPGTYVWTWGTGPDQNFTLQIGPATVPDTGSSFALLALALAALFGASRLRSIRLA